MKPRFTQVVNRLLNMLHPLSLIGSQLVSTAFFMSTLVMPPFNLLPVLPAAMLTMLCMLSVAMFSVTMFSVTMFSVTMFSVTMFSVTMFSVTMFSVTMFSVTMLSVTMFSVTMLSVAMLFSLTTLYMLMLTYLDTLLVCPDAGAKWNEDQQGRHTKAT